MSGNPCFIEDLSTWSDARQIPSPDDELWIKVVWQDDIPWFERYIWNADENAKIGIPFPYWERAIEQGTGVVAVNMFNDPWGPQSVTDPER